MDEVRTPIIAFCDNSLRELINFRGPIMESFLCKGYDVIAICPKNRDIPDLGARFKHIDVRLSRGGMNPFKDISYFISLYRIYKRNKVSYVFHYTIKPNIYGTIAARLLGIKSTMMIAGLGYVFKSESLGSRIGRTLYRIAIKLSEYIMVLNKENYNYLLNNKMVNKDKLILLEGGEGIDLSKY